MGGIIFSSTGTTATGLISSVITATIGTIILLFMVGLIRRA
ncbi:GlsB/YeaQ/YmgE family stress response membrane protein [Sulfuriflexus sp.]